VHRGQGKEKSREGEEEGTDEDGREGRVSQHNKDSANNTHLSE
jgi:hypothetical protein